MVVMRIYFENTLSKCSRMQARLSLSNYTRFFPVTVIVPGLLCTIFWQLAGTLRMLADTWRELRNGKVFPSDKQKKRGTFLKSD